VARKLSNISPIFADRVDGSNVQMKSSEEQPVSIGVDIGGTFTDIVACSTLGETQVRSRKVLTTEPSPEDGILAGLAGSLQEFGLGLSNVSTIVHGTTLAINSVVQRKGARTALVTTNGFRDILTLAREYRYDIYDLNAAPPEPLVDRSGVFVLDERTSRDGVVSVEPASDELEQVAQMVGERGYESVAVCLINSYANGHNEALVARHLQEFLPDVPVSVSSELSAQVREYERAMLAVINAYVAPKVGGYLRRLETKLRDQGFEGDWYVLGSNGGLLAPDTAARLPVRIMESGPAGGAVAASLLAGSSGESLGLDMGGTTAKAFVLEPGEPRISTEFEIARVETHLPGSGYPIALPVVDLLEIGAGGGSIAKIDATGLMTVGPESAGASPGPACYGLGGLRPTVTDANLHLGLLGRSEFEDGTQLRRDLAESALASLADDLELGVNQVAAGVHEVATHHMAEALRSHLVERGMAAKDASLVAYGGAGPTHAGGIADALGIRRVVFPDLAGVLSAAGFLATQPRYDYVRSMLVALEASSLAAIEEAFVEEAARAGQVVRQAADQGVSTTEHRSLDLRYRGQGHEFQLPIDTGHPLTANGRAREIRADFEAEFKRRFGRVFSASEIEIVSIRGEVRADQLTLDTNDLFASDQSPSTIEEQSRESVFLPHTRDWAEVWTGTSSHGLLNSGVVGPALVHAPHSTAFVPPGWTISRSQDGELAMRKS
jgi:N-methylhydantoinase A